MVAWRIPSAAGDPPFRSWWDTVGRRGASPKTAALAHRAIVEADVRDAVGLVTCPVLLLTRLGCASYDPGHGRYLQAHLRDATLREVEDPNDAWFIGNVRGSSNRWTGSSTSGRQTFVSVTRPPFDPELALTLEAIRERLPPTVTPEMVQPMRDAPPPVGIDEILTGRPITRRDHTIAGYEGGGIDATVFARDGHTGTGPAIIRFHGGGMVMGSRFAGINQTLTWVERFDAVCVTVDYRLAPEHPDPYPVEDCYATLVWTVEHAVGLGIDTERIVVTGPSAGGGLAAGVALLARERGGPALLGQMLVSPMLDDRNDTVSAHQIDGVGVWDRSSNDTGWNALLGDRRGTDAVSVYAAPARATDLAGLPPAFVECGSAEVFRDEDVAYASGLWAAGSQAELHVWPGGFHACDQLAPSARLSRDMTAARDAWMARLLGS